MTRRSLLVGVALIGVLLATVCMWPKSNRERTTAGRARDTIPGELADLAPGPPGNIEGTVVAIGEPVPGASVWVTNASGALGREPCPCDFDDTALLLDLLCDCAEAEELLTDAILAGHGEPEPVATAETNTEGAFAVVGLPGGVYTLWAEHETGGIGLVAGVRVDAGHQVIDLEPALLLDGTVLGDADEPVPDAEVVVVHTLTNRFTYTSSDADGRFEVLTHAEGEYFLVATAEGYFPTLEFFFPEEHEIEVFLDSPRQIVGRVLYRDNTPAAGVSVTLRGWGKRLTTTAGKRGRFGFEDIRPGEYYVLAEERRQLDGKLIEVLSGEDRTNVLLRLHHVAGGELFGVVRDEAGDPIGGARVVVFGDDTWGEDAAVADREGRYQVRPLAGGYYELEAEAPGHGKACAEVDIFASEPTELDLVLGEEASARGVVVMADGTPVADAPIWLESDEEEGAPYDVDLDYDDFDYDDYEYDYPSAVLMACGDEESVTGADGSFSLRAAAGAYTVVVLYGGPIPHEHQVTLPDPSIRIEIPSHAKVRGQVVDARGRPATTAILTLMAPDGLVSPYAIDSEARFELEGLVNGHYELRAEVGDGFGLSPEATVEFEVRAAVGPDELTLRFPPGMLLSGRVVFPDGEPAPSGMVRATHLTTGGSDHTDVIDGEFLFEDVPGGPFVLEAFVPGYPVSHVDARGGDRDITITLNLGRAVSGRVVEAGTGAAIADATVSANLEHGPTDAVPITGTDADGRFVLETLWNREVLLTVAIDSVPVHQSWVASTQSRVVMAVDPPDLSELEEDTLAEEDLAEDIDLWSDDPTY